MQERIDEINRVLREQITGVRVIRAFVRDRRRKSRFGDGQHRAVHRVARRRAADGADVPAVMLVLNFSSVAVLWFGGHLVAAGSMPIGALTAFLTYLLQILMSVMMATFMFVMVPRAEVCAERITEVLDTEPTSAPPAHAGAPAAVRGQAGAAPGGVPLPGAEEPVLSRRSGSSPARRGHRDHRRHRQRQVHADQPRSRGCST